MTLYIYADETHSNDGKRTNGLIGYGMLLVEQPISDKVIQWALDELKKEIEDGKIDDPRDHNTVKNGHFHATDDSPAGRGHICQSINNNINGNFNFLT